MTLVFAFAIFSLFLGIFETNAEDVCPSNWVPYGNSCYLVRKEKLSWQQAATECRAYEGGHLAIIDDRVENFFMTMLLFDHKVRGDVWFDGSNRNHDGKWEWVDTDEAITDGSYQNWEPNEPDNFKMNEHCLAIGYWDANDNQWNDLDCERKEFSVCERPDISQTIVHITTVVEYEIFDFPQSVLGYDIRLVQPHVPLEASTLKIANTSDHFHVTYKRENCIGTTYNC